MRWPFQKPKEDTGDRPLYNAKISRQKPSVSPLSFEEQLQNGYYLGILDSYDVKWNQEKTVRDILQNFFDPTKSLDNIKVTVSQLPDDESLARPIHIQISGPEQFDYVKLLHLGGSSKTGDLSTAGGFGEGAKIAALVLMRDFKCQQITYSSNDWQLEFFFQAPPDGSYDIASTRGLHVRLNRTKKIGGNSIQIITTDSSFPTLIEESKNLFFHKNNPDFQDPSFIASLHDGAQFGFKILPKTSPSTYSAFDSGHFYDAGQRRHYDSANGGWAQVEGMHIWCIGRKTFGDERDRGAVGKTDFRDKFIKELIDELPIERCIELVQILKDTWPNKSASYFYVIAEVLEAASKKLEDAGVKLEFPSTLLATEAFTPMYINDALETAGYTLCRGHLVNIGMRSAASQFKEMQSHLKIKPSLVQETKCEILQSASNIILKTPGGTEPKPIWLYSQENEKSIIQGQYNESFIWLSEECLNKDFFEALSTHLHEIDHAHGSDQSAEFSYALTKTLAKALGAYDRHHTELSSLRVQWNTLNT